MSILENWIRKGLFFYGLVGSLTFFGCHKSDITPPVQNYPPGVALDVSETSGDSPLSVHMKVSSMDKDIVSYRLYLDGVVDSSSSPIDTVMTFYPSTHTVYGEAVNAKRLSSKTSTTSITANLIDDNYWYRGNPLPKGKINLFVGDSADVDYNKRKNRKDRDDFLEMARASDITPTILNGIHQVNGVDYGWACVQASELFEYNSHDWIDLYDSDRKKYGWYMGDNIDSIYYHHGTTKFRGSHKAPIFIAQVSPAHQMNYAVTGNDLRDGKSNNFVEAMYPVSKSNAKFDGTTYPSDWSDFILYYEYVYIDKNGRNTFTNIPLVKYNLVGGVLQFVATNPNLDVIMTRDTLPIGINVTSPVQGKEYSANGKVLLDEVVTSGTNQISDDSFRYAYYSFDGGATKIAMGPKDTKDLIYNGNRYFKSGNYTLSLYAKNEFFMDTNKNISFTVK